ncbi:MULTISPECIES: hypothetical protein [Streptomyces]|uniref:Secreted protein n=1 Tax=Streptomyces griseiscabiei TaxID=2993540 RepID=A0ABU4LDD2_9ACTN|nr:MULTISPECIES: hypothetical protein [Streptomyces]MBZ3906710.1 hypothetical protein [Streptomyces griseiscabiei]MDX2913775.1 hypothetical protein [Streptomyces griseiscabiei]
MPRRAPRELRAGGSGGQAGGAVSTLLVGACPGPPACTSVHTYLFVDGLDMITRSDSGMAGLAPEWLLRPGGPLCPTDMPRTVEVATRIRPEPAPDTLTVRIRLRGDTVVWSGTAYPGPDGGPVEEVRFGLEQYLGEIERAYGALVDRP